jgi:hypothetical protein
MSHAVESSEFLALTNRPTSDGVRRFATVEHRDGRLSVKATNVRERSVTPAEVAQAQLFEDILQAEVAELEQLAYRLAGSPDRQPEFDSHEVARDLLRIHERIEEVRRLLHALHGRFPRPRWDAAPKAE